MRSIAIALSGVLLSACYTYETYQPAPSSAVRARPRVLSEREAIRAATELCRDRGLDVGEVRHAELDRDGRWRVELRGPTGDRAKLLLDAENGRLIKGRFRDGDGAAEAAPASPGPEGPPAPPNEDGDWDGDEATGG